MTKRLTPCLGWTTAVLVAGLGASTPALAEQMHIVLPGGSIQQAVDAAKPGDTIFILPGTYRESVLISKSHVTLEGAGRHTVITGGAHRSGSGHTCAGRGNGICVIGHKGHVVKGVGIRSLTVSGFAKNGIWASGTDRLRVYDVTARNNGQWGIAQDRSTRGVFRYNTVRNSGEAGILVANDVNREANALDTRGTVVLDNRLFRNKFGLTVRRTRHLLVAGNRISGNCAGVFIVGDEHRPPAGALTVSHNLVYRNNKYCPKGTRGHLPKIQGAGIVLTGAEKTLVTRNTVRNNRGTSPFSGGIVLFRSFGGGPDQHHLISRNVVVHNSPADLANREKDGIGNRFVHNRCRISEPAGLC